MGDYYLGCATKEPSLSQGTRGEISKQAVGKGGATGKDMQFRFVQTDFAAPETSK